MRDPERDPERIPRILTKLQAAWEKHPDIRLGQFLSNCVHSRNSDIDLFYVEDEELERWIESEIEQHLNEA